jgi:hypothetical protein
MKMNILIQESISPGFAILSAAHSSLAAFLKFKDSTKAMEWPSVPFYKVICNVSESEFEKAKGLDDHVVLTESALENREVAIAFKPSEEWPTAFRY